MSKHLPLPKASAAADNLIEVLDRVVLRWLMEIEASRTVPKVTRLAHMVGQLARARPHLAAARGAAVTPGDEPELRRESAEAWNARHEHPAPPGRAE